MYHNTKLFFKHEDYESDSSLIGLTIPRLFRSYCADSQRGLCPLHIIMIHIMNKMNKFNPPTSKFLIDGRSPIFPIKVRQTKNGWFSMETKTKCVLICNYYGKKVFPYSCNGRTNPHKYWLHFINLLINDSNLIRWKAKENQFKILNNELMMESFREYKCGGPKTCDVENFLRAIRNSLRGSVVLKKVKDGGPGVYEISFL